MITSISISVRQLVEFLLRSGDIDNRTGGSDEDVMQEGSRMHRQLQKAQPEGYRAEVPLRLAWVFEKRLAARADDTDAKTADGRESLYKPILDDVTVYVEGRADGIYCARKTEGSTKNKKNKTNKTNKTNKKKDEQRAGHSDHAQSTESTTAAGEGKEQGIWTIDEIKTTYRRISRMRQPEPVHLAQAKCYAYIYAVQHDLSCVNVRMTYCNLYSGDIRYFYEQEDMQTLSAWFSALMEEYRKWAEYTLLWQARRTISIRQMTFPFPFREGQKRLVAGVYRTIEEGKKLFLEAPTGTGKTISTLYPSLKAMGNGMGDKIFYLTAKTVTRTAAADTIALLRSRGLLCKSVVLTAKSKVCVLPRPDCNPEKCPRARGHYDRINMALFDMLTGTDNFDRDTLQAYATRYQVCPFEMALDISIFCDVVIGDYNHLFDPHAYLRRFFGDTTTKRNDIFLVDEAHNLLDRGRKMYSAVLTLQDIETMLEILPDIYPSMEEKLVKTRKALNSIRKKREGQGQADSAAKTEEANSSHPLLLPDIPDLAAAVNELQMELESILAQERIELQSGKARKDPRRRQKAAVHDALLAFYFDISHFNLIYALHNDRYLIYADEIAASDAERNFDDAARKRFSRTAAQGTEQNLPAHSFGVRILCVDPSEKLAGCMKRGRSTILFSATLLPIQYYKSLLGGTKEDYEIYAHSVFDQEKRELLIVRDVTSRYQRRGPAEYEKMADCIHRVTGQRHGNYLIFCPSFHFMNAVADAYEEKYLGIPKTMLVPYWKEGGYSDWEVFEENTHTSLVVQHASDGAGAPPDHTVPPSDISVLRQQAGMKEQQKEQFLDYFRKPRDDSSMLGFCVLGGVFGEGIDLKKDSLIGAIIIGTGLPMIGTERELVRYYFEQKNKNGFQYAYVYPGMNKVLQAAGRVIRTQEDVGVIALLDERFATPAYRSLFPAEWKNYRITTVKECGYLVEKFWNEWL